MLLRISSRLRELSFSSAKLVITGIVFAAVFLIGILYTASQPRLYEARARVWVQSKSDYSSGEHSQMQSPFLYTFTSPITTASEVIRSAAVIKEARDYLIKSLPGKEVPSVDEIRARLKVEPVRDADIIVITYRDPHNWAASAVVNGVVDGFIRVNNAQNAGNAGQSKVYLAKQLKLETENYLIARRNLKRFQDQNQAVDLNQQMTAMLKQATDLQTDLEAARAKLSESKSKEAFLARELGVSPEAAISMETLSRDDVLQALKQKLAAEDVHIIDLSSRLQESHPRLRQAKETQAQLQQAMTDRVRFLLGTLDSSAALEHLPVDTPVRQNMITELIRARTEELSEETRISSLEAALADTNGRLKSVPAQEASLAELMRAAKSAAEAVSDVEKRLQAAKLSESLASRTSNVQVIDGPETPMFPSYPNVHLYLLVTLVAAALSAGTAYYCMTIVDPHAKRPEQIRALLPLPIVSWVSQTESSMGLSSALPAMRRLRSAVRAWLIEGRKKILVTSADDDDDRRLTAAGLAMSCAESGMKVVLIDADLSRPKLHRLLNVPAAPGFVEYVSQYPNVPAAAIVRSINENLRFVSAGAVVESSRNILTSSEFNKLIKELEPSADVIVVDCAPVSEYSDSLTLADETTEVLIVLPLKRTLKRAIGLVANQLQHRPINASIVLTNANESAVSDLISQPTGTPAPSKVAGSSASLESASAGW